MKTDTATIIAFSDAHRATEAKHRRRQPIHQLASQPDTPLTAEEHDRYVASVVRIAIRSAKRRGVRLESMLSIPRKWLLDLCDEGDPTCLVVRDWLLGNRKCLPRDLEDAATGWTSGKWGDA